LLFGIIAISALFGSPTSVEVNLGPGETRLFEPSETTRSGIEVTDHSGLVQTHFFNNKPPISDTTANNNYSTSGFTFTAGWAEEWNFYLIAGSTVNATWSSSGDIDFHIVKGKDNFDKWMDGEDTQIFSRIEAAFSYTFTASSNDDYYFILYNYRSVALVADVYFEVEAKTYDISDSARLHTGSFSESLGTEKYIVLFNPSDIDIEVKYTENPKYSFGTVFIVLIVSIIIIIWIIRRVIKSREKSRQTTQIAPTGLPSIHSPPSQVKQPQYHQRPSATFCNACGSGLLPGSDFCSECGTKT
jgi:hypothetical protein